MASGERDRRNVSMLVQARSLAPAGLEDLSVIRMLSAAPRPQRVDVGHHPEGCAHDALGRGRSPVLWHCIHATFNHYPIG